MRPVRPAGLVFSVDGKAALSCLVDDHREHAIVVADAQASFCDQASSKLLLQVWTTFAHFDGNILIPAYLGFLSFDKAAQSVRNGGREVVPCQFLCFLEDGHIGICNIDGSVGHNRYSLS